MTRLLLILTTLAFSVVFMLFNVHGTMGFPYSEMTLTTETWFYFLFEHLILVLLAIVILDLEHEYKYSAGTFLIIEIVDTVDYCLSYGEIFMSWNTVKVVIFGLVALAEVIRHKIRVA